MDLINGLSQESIYIKDKIRSLVHTYMKIGSKWVKEDIRESCYMTLE